ncbi:MAG TPA: SDR family NAD(P)-dependent oxidoreductase [Ktedonobacteraceae bacterium]|nr:SDR family NAD(P)-dependent oxidoreductase [Ktedonobacteraceae bacterium]
MGSKYSEPHVTTVDVLKALLTGWKITRKKRVDFQGKVVLITGGSRGLGLALAEEFALQGGRIVICSHEEEELELARRRLAEQGANVLAIPCDMTQRDQVQHLIDQATTHYGRIDILVNNAGIITVGPIEAQTLDDYEDSMRVIYWGAVHATMAALPQMLERKQGHIVNISSIGGKVSVPHLLPYASAKFALTGFSEGLYAELKKKGIHVVTVIPGLMRTGSPVNAFFKGKHHAEYTWFDIANSLPLLSISAKKAARSIVKATRKNKAQITLTLPAKLLARFHGLFPGLTMKIMSIADRLLPRAGEVQGLDRRTGKESETALSQSFLTTLGQRAAQEYNQYASQPSKSSLVAVSSDGVECGKESQ